MQFLLQKIWELLLPIPMPWQVVIVFLLAMPLAPLIILRCLPWLTVKILHIVSFFVELIVQFLLLIEYRTTRIIRNSKANPPEIFYILGDILVKCVRYTQFSKVSSEHLSKNIFRVPWKFRQKKWYALPLILLPIWILRPYLGNSSFTVFIDSSVAQWCSLEQWIQIGEWIPSELTCSYPNSSPRWNAFLKTKEYQLKREIQEYTREIDTHSNNQNTYYDRGNAYLDIENIEAAFKDYTSSVKIDPKYAPGYFGRGQIYLLQKDKSGALKEFSNAVSVDPKYAPGYFGRGQIYLLQKDKSGALKEFSKAMSVDPKYALSYVGLGYIYQTEGDKDAALQEYNKAIQIDPNCALAYEKLANLYYQNNDNKAAIKQYKKAAEISLKVNQIELYNEVVSILDKLQKISGN